LLTIAYCPTFFSGAGALVSINPQTGAYTIQNTFDWPSEVAGDGCGGSAMDSPAYAVDRSSSILYLDFVSDFGLLVALDMTNGNTQAITPSNDFFTGYENMAVVNPSLIQGLSGTVTVDGWCSNGCFGWSSMSTSSGQQQILKNVPYKAVMDDSHIYDKTRNQFWFQASYPLNQQAYCSTDETQLCLINIDANTGNLISTKFTNWTVYKFAGNMDSKTTVLAWLYGFDGLCDNPYDDFLFARVNLLTATATPIACIPKSVVDQEDEWISDFSLDNPNPSYFATASGDGDSGEAQLLIFRPANGSAVVNNNLPGLGTALGSVDGIYWIWGVTFL